MDPISQGIVGTVVVQQAAKLVSNKRQLVAASGLGFVSAMAPDLDVLIRSGDDPMLFLEYHRQFTHSLAFVPVGGLLCALLGQWVLGARAGLSFAVTLAVCTLAYATHGLLDACTSYGTLLLWPFSDARIAWHVMPIVDPFYTLPLIAFCIARIKTGKKVWSHIALIWLLAMPLIGLVQRERATTVAIELAAERGHDAQRLSVRPGFGNLVVWKAIYQAEEDGQSRYFVDAIHVAAGHRVYTGESIDVLNLQRDLPWLSSMAGSQQAKDIERFSWFSNNYLSIDPANPNRIVDMRYSMLPHQVKPFWGIVLDPQKPNDQHVDYTVTRRPEPNSFSTLGQMILARDLASEAD